MSHHLEISSEIRGLLCDTMNTYMQYGLAIYSYIPWKSVMAYQLVYLLLLEAAFHPLAYYDCLMI